MLRWFILIVALLLVPGRGAPGACRGHRGDELQSESATVLSYREGEHHKDLQDHALSIGSPIPMHSLPAFALG